MKCKRFFEFVFAQVRVLLAAKMTRIQMNVGYPLMKSLVKFVIGHLEKGGTKVKCVVCLSKDDLLIQIKSIIF